MRTFIYQENLRTLNQDIFKGELTNKLISALRAAHVGTGPSQNHAFDESLFRLGYLFGAENLCQDIQCCIEYQIRASGGYRIDFMLSGYDENDQKNVIVIELKQWSSDNVHLIPHSNNIEAFVAQSAGLRETVHPSFQSFNYCDLLNLFYERVNSGEIRLHPCSFLHNYEEKSPPILSDERFVRLLELSPLYTKKDNAKLLEFVQKYIKKPDNREIFEILNNSRICPTNDLQNNVKKIFLSGENFKLYGNQQVAYNAIMAAIKQAILTEEKKVFIIKGGPGTGKSIIALKLMASVISDLKRIAFYVTQTSAPKGAVKKEIQKSVDPHGLTGSAVSELVQYAGNWVMKERELNELDCVIVDEAHRLKTSTQGAKVKETSIIREIIKSAKVSVFFLDENQEVTHTDAGTIENIKKACLDITGAEAVMKEEYNLVSQFRCGGSSGFMAFVDHVLYGIPYPDDELTFEYDVAFFSGKPMGMAEAIKEKREQGYHARLVAGYCYDYKDHVGTVTPVNMPWNRDVQKWASDPNAASEVGCVYSSQGLEFDYVGVVIGKDMKYVGEKVDFDPEEHSKDDHTFMNANFKRTPENLAKARKYIRNAYNVLLTRGMKGCYIYCEDEALAAYLEREWAELKRQFGK